ncbi:Endonuclease/exonuclease/phosphatase superfamily [Sesbania bispinosa]|nr:Endonuclease/exonuclease/phosphatase superfamily [Sesbania bispinosa]
MELDHKGCKFTWISNPINGFTTRKRHDRVLVNWPWRSYFQHALAIASPPISSDHSPIIMWPKPKLNSGKSFKYEAF